MNENIENTEKNDRDVDDKYKENKKKIQRKTIKKTKIDIEKIEDLESKKSAFSDAVLKYKKKTKSRTQIFLEEIEDDIQKAIENGMSFAELSREIKKVFGVDISSTTISKFSKKFKKEKIFDDVEDEKKSKNR